jgi:hypothetical protein
MIRNNINEAMPRSFDDHIKWLMERKEFERALEEIKNSEPNSLKFYTYQVIFSNFFQLAI